MIVTLGAAQTLQPIAPVSSMTIQAGRMDLAGNVIQIVISDGQGNTVADQVLMSPSTKTAVEADIVARLAARLGTSVVVATP